MLLHRRRWKWKETTTGDFLKLSKENLCNECSQNCFDFFQMIFGWEQMEENNNTTRNSTRSDILTLLALMSADAKSAEPQRVSSLTKVEVHNFLLLHFPKWFCLGHGQFFMPLWRVQSLAIYKCQCFCLFDI